MGRNFVPNVAKKYNKKENDIMSKKCIVCGTELDNTAVFCDECGAKQGDAKEIRI